MKRWLTAAIAVWLEASLVSCAGSSAPETCGLGAGPPHPEIGGEVLYYCNGWPQTNGGIFLLDVATGWVRALTSGRAWNLDGAWSPDGSRIAFQSTRGGRDDIYVMDADGTGVRRLTDGRGFNEYPSWSPDGEWILFNSTRDGVADAAGTGYYRDLYLIRPDGSDVHRVSRHFGTFAFAAWSPDGHRLAFQSDRAGNWDVYTMAADGAGIEQVTHHGNTAGAGASFPRWSPDGSQIVFSGSKVGEPGSIYILTPGEAAARRVTFGVPGLVWDGYPDWSPRGDWVVFERNASAQQLFAVRPDGSDLTQLTNGSGFKALPRWRPL